MVKKVSDIVAEMVAADYERAGAVSSKLTKRSHK